MRYNLKITFDGDEMNLTLLESHHLVNSFHKLDPIYNVMSPDKPHELSGALKLPAPVIATAANWINRSSDTHYKNA